MARLFPTTISQRPKGSLFISEVHPGYNEIDFLPSKEVLKDLGGNEDVKTLILEVNSPHNFVSIHPINTQHTSPKFLQPKYNSLKFITLDGFDYGCGETEDEVLEILENFPSGFVKDYDYGLGLLNDFNSLVYTLEGWDIKHLVICKEESTRIEEEHSMLILLHKEFEYIRKAIKRITYEARSASAQVKRITVNNLLSSFLGNPESYPQKTLEVKDTTLAKLIAKSSPVINAELTGKDQKLAVNLVSNNCKKIVEKQPETLIKLRNTIELVSLEELIKRYQSLLVKKAKETTWQKLFQQNPFILSLAFSSSIIILKDQAYVGGIGIDGSGSKICDFFGVNSLSDNATIIEIKTPSVKLLNKTPYRDNVYNASKELAGSVSQVLDQRMKFQQHIHSLKANSKGDKFEAYYTAGILIIGTMPADTSQKQSFELFRGNSKDVVIITFDELLDKLRLLLDSLKGDQK